MHEGPRRLSGSDACADKLRRYAAAGVGHLMVDCPRGLSTATMLSIALGHATDALCHCLGEVRERSATMTVRRKSFTIAETGERMPRTADDQVCVSGLLDGGAALSIHYRGGRSRGTNLLWEINGTEGDLQLIAAGRRTGRRAARSIGSAMNRPGRLASAGLSGAD